MTEKIVSQDRQRTAVFLSYSRKDTPFLQRLVVALESRGYEPVFDRSERSNADPDMLLTAQDEWWAALKSMIAACDVMVFIVTPDSAASAVCDDEIAHARALGKRVIAVLRREIDFRTVPERPAPSTSRSPSARTTRLRSLPRSNNFAQNSTPTSTGIVAAHDSRGWRTSGKGTASPKANCCCAGAISDADAWAARRPGGAPEPGELLLAYLAASRELEAADRNNLLKGVANGFAVRADKAASEKRFVHAAKCVGAAALLCDDMNFSPERAVHAWRLGARALFDAAHVVLGNRCGKITDAQWAPDGRLVTTTSSDGGCRLWDPDTGKLRYVLNTSGSGARTCRFSNDGSALVVACEDGAVRLFEVATGRHIGDCGYHEGGARIALFLPHAPRVISAGRDCVIRVWDLNENREIAELRGHTKDILDLDVSQSGEFIASSGQDGRPRSWSMNSYNEIARPDCKSKVITDGSFPGVSAVFSPDMCSILSGSPTGEVAIWDVRTGKTHLYQRCHEDAAFHPAFSPDGQLFVSPGYFDYVAKVWKSANGEWVTDLVGHRSGIWKAVFSPDGGRIATGDVDGEVRLWDVGTGKELRRLLGHEKTVASITFSPDGKKLLTGSNDGTARIWDASCGALRSKVTVENGAIQDVHVLSNKGFLATLGKDKRARLWTLSGDLVTTIGDGTNHPQVVQFSTNGERLIVAEPGKPPAVYRTEDGALVRNLFEPLEWEMPSFVSPNDKFVFLRHNKGWVCVDATDESEVLRLEAEKAGHDCGAFTEDGSRLILGCDDGKVYLITPGAEPRVIETDGHSNTVTSVGFSPSGAYAVSAGWDGVARI